MMRAPAPLRLAISICRTAFVLEVSTMLADIVGRRKAEVERDEAQEQAAKEAAARAAAEAEVERLRRLIEGNGAK